MAKLHAFEHASDEVGSICRHDLGRTFPAVWEHRKSPDLEDSKVSVTVLADNDQRQRGTLAENHCRCSVWTEFHSLMGVRPDQVELVYECVWEQQLKEWLLM